MKRFVKILNGSFHSLTRDETVGEIFDFIDAGRRGWLCTVNVSGLMDMRSDPFLQSFVERAEWVVADGQPLVWCSHLLGNGLPERVTGIDIIDPICSRAASEGKRVYLLGAEPDILAKALEKLRERHPNLMVEGAHGYFPPAEARQRAKAVAASEAALLLVGMGCPRQERFIDEHWAHLGASVAIGVGGSFDVISGRLARAYPWVQAAGLEWAVRLAQEPLRLFMRYLTSNTKFISLMIREIFRSRETRGRLP